MGGHIDPHPLKRAEETPEQEGMVCKRKTICGAGGDDASLGSMACAMRIPSETVQHLHRSRLTQSSPRRMAAAKARCRQRLSQALRDSIGWGAGVEGSMLA